MINHLYILGIDIKNTASCNPVFAPGAHSPGLADAAVPMLPIVGVDNETRCSTYSRFGMADICEVTHVHLMRLNRPLEVFA